MLTNSPPIYKRKPSPPMIQYNHSLKTVQEYTKKELQLNANLATDLKSWHAKKALFTVIYRFSNCAQNIWNKYSVIFYLGKAAKGWLNENCNHENIFFNRIGASHFDILKVNKIKYNTYKPKYQFGNIIKFLLIKSENVIYLIQSNILFLINNGQ